MLRTIYCIRTFYVLLSQWHPQKVYDMCPAHVSCLTLFNIQLAEVMVGRILVAITLHGKGIFCSVAKSFVTNSHAGSERWERISHTKKPRRQRVQDGLHHGSQYLQNQQKSICRLNPSYMQVMIGIKNIYNLSSFVNFPSNKILHSVLITMVWKHKGSWNEEKGTKTICLWNVKNEVLSCFNGAVTASYTCS